MTAIGFVKGILPTGFKEVQIVRCEDTSFNGKSHANAQNIREGEYYVFTFDPQDQFCQVVPLNKIRPQ